MSGEIPNQKQSRDELVDPMDVVEELMQRFQTAEEAGFQSPEARDAALLQMVENMAAVVLTDPVLTEMFLVKGNEKLASTDETVQ